MNTVRHITAPSGFALGKDGCLYRAILHQLEGRDMYTTMGDRRRCDTLSTLVVRPGEPDCPFYSVIRVTYDDHRPVFGECDVVRIGKCYLEYVWHPRGRFGSIPDPLPAAFTMVPLRLEFPSSASEMVRKLYENDRVFSIGHDRTWTHVTLFTWTQDNIEYPTRIESITLDCLRQATGQWHLTDDECRVPMILRFLHPECLDVNCRWGIVYE